MRILTLLLCLLIPIAIAQDAQTLEVRARYAECNMLEKRSNVYEFQRVLLGNDLGPWQRADPKAVDVYSAMKVHASKSQIRSVYLEESSASGDWSSTTSYCFRANGTLAFQFRKYRTFSTDAPHAVEVQTRSYFAASGKRFKLLETILDVVTNKAVKASYMPMPETTFPTSSGVVKEIGSGLLPLK